MMRRMVVLLALACLAACARADTSRAPFDTSRAPAGVLVAPGAQLPRPEIAAPDAAPRILAVRLGSRVVNTGDRWTGRIVTTTNVASLEVRSPGFTFVAHRTTYGSFDFDEHVLFLTPVYRRVATVTFVARNAAGIADKRYVTVDFR